MKTVTISEAKAKLSALVESAEKGEQILIMRGSKPAVTLIPVHDEDLVIWPSLHVSERAAQALLVEADKELKTGKFFLLMWLMREMQQNIFRNMVGS